MKKLLILPFLIFSCNVLFAQTIQEFITVDQFGYRTNAKKIAVIKNPKVGFDASLTYTPGTVFSLVEASSGQVKFTAPITEWKTGQTDASSGDQAWHFDFSSYTEPGTYYILDVQKNLRSFSFKIQASVYKDVLKHAARTFFYQRAGHAKAAPFAEAAWVDGASHIGPLQDKNARAYNAKNDASTEKDVSGGWYDAGDYNKYTSWTAGYILELLMAYERNPEAFTDDFNIPESGNGVPDIIDEALWGLKHLQRLQNANGSMISIVSLSEGTPPSSATGPSYYGAVNTSSTLAASGVFAYASKMMKTLNMDDLAAEFKINATKAWDWAELNPSVIWYNNDVAYGSKDIGAGQQEVDDYGRLCYKIRASVFLFDLTNELKYHTYFLANYENIEMIKSYYIIPFHYDHIKPLLYYTLHSQANVDAKQKIISRYSNAIQGTHYLTAFNNSTDPYRAYMKDYTWGSNSTKARTGLQFLDIISYNVNSSLNNKANEAAEEYIHYINGRNPLSLVYLSNMNTKGASKSVTQFFHSWFKNGSALWDQVGVSTYGPAPGFLTGGPNPGYKLHNCCVNKSCGAFNGDCIILAPPMNQPTQKSYLDFNTSYPQNSWEISENSGGYQAAYISLLSNFVEKDPMLTGDIQTNVSSKLSIHPNPSTGNFWINSDVEIKYIEIYNSHGKLVQTEQLQSKIAEIKTQLEKGIYFLVSYTTTNQKHTHKFIIQ